MSSTKLSRTYANGLFGHIYHEYKNREGVSANTKFAELQEIDQALLLLTSLFESSPPLSLLIQNRTYPENQKLTLLLELFPDAPSTMKSFLSILAERNHLYLVPGIQKNYRKVLFEFQNITRVHISFASILQKRVSKRFFTTIQKIVKTKNLLLSCSYEPNLIAGFAFEFNSLSIDASFLRLISLLFFD